jgi:hypothetical protein
MGAVVVRRGADGILAATIPIAGRRTGLHGLRWRLKEPLHGKTLAAGERELGLSAGQDAVELTFDGLALARAYFAQVLAGSNADVMVDETLELELRLEPRLSAEDIGLLPARETHNLRLGDSALVQTVSVRFELGFERRGGVPRLLP